MKRGFGSDNHSGVHPALLAAIGEANTDHAPSYGTDEWSERADKVFREHFGPHTEIYYVFNGTAANVLALGSLIQSFESVLVSDISHLQNDECAAPEFFTGAKLLPLTSHHGKIRLEDMKSALIRRGDQHHSQVRAVSITQPTEVGTLYSLAEIAEICTWAHSQGLWVHLDGARIANAVTELHTSFAEMTTHCGIDVLSFGGTKNGFLYGEAVVFLNPKLAQNFKYRRKQAAQLPSKTRFISAQFERYLGTGLWREISEHECQMAERLYQSLKNLAGLEVTQIRQSNAVFAKIPQTLVKRLREKYFFYVWDEKTFECRLMMSWDTKEEDIDGFVHLLKTQL
jgi:threonine aldolase